MKCLLFIAVSIISVSVFACSGDDDSSTNNSNSICALEFVKSYEAGMFPNAMMLHNGMIYITDSGNNEIDTYNIERDIYTDTVIKLPKDSNPVQSLILNNSIYIISSAANTLSQYSINDFSELKVTGNFNMPYSITSDGKNIYIANSEYNYSAQTAEGSISIVAADIITNRKTECKNPTVIQSADDGFILSCAGIYQYAANGSISESIGSALQRLDSSLSVITEVLKDKDPGTFAVSDNIILSGSSFDGTLKLFSKSLEPLDSKSFADGSTPVMLIPHHIQDSIFAAANFNTDEISIIDTGNHKINVLNVYKSSSTPVARKGPISIVYDRISHTLAVLNSISNTLDIYRLSENCTSMQL